MSQNSTKPLFEEKKKDQWFLDKDVKIFIGNSGATVKSICLGPYSQRIKALVLSDKTFVCIEEVYTEFKTIGDDQISLKNIIVGKKREKEVPVHCGTKEIRDSFYQEIKDLFYKKEEVTN